MCPDLRPSGPPQGVSTSTLLALWARSFALGGDDPVHRGVLTSIPGLSLLDISSRPFLTPQV